MWAAVHGTSALVFAGQWLAVCLLGAVISWALLVFILRRQLGSPSADRGPLFAALFLATFGAANLYIEARAFGLHVPLIAAPAQLLFLLLFYIYPNSSYAGRSIRWLRFVYAFAQVSAYIPQQKPSNPTAVTVMQAPGVTGVFMVLGETVGLVPIVIGILPQIYARSRRLARIGSQPLMTWRTEGVLVIIMVVASYVALVVAGMLALPDMTSTASTVAAAPPLNALRLGFFLLTSLVPVGAAFALVSGRHYDRAALLHRALNDVTLVASLLLVYALGVMALQIVLPGYGGPGYAYLPFILAAGALLAAIYPPLRAQVETQISRRFFRETFEARQVLAAASPALRAEMRPDQLCAQLMTAVEKALRPGAVALWVRAPAPAGVTGLRTSGMLAPTAPSPGAGSPPPSPDATQLRWYASASGFGSSSGSAPAGAATLTLADDDPACASLRRPATAVDIDRLPADSASAGALRAAGMRLALPLVSQGELEGVLALAPQPGARLYGDDERELLATLAGEVAPALRAAQIAHRQDVEARERERVEQELQTARRIQESLLPKTVPALDGWQIATCYQPAREVGGDFYDFIALDDDRLGIVLGDVTDKGIPAALVMATTRSMLRAVATQPAVTPGAVLAQVNDLLCPDLPTSMFVTCFYAVLTPASGRIQYANAGQDLPYLRHPDGGVAELRAKGMPLGLLPDSTYDEHETTLAPGDSLLFFSDGIVEAHNPAREMFGLPRMKQLVAEHAASTPPIVYLLHELVAFTGTDWEQEDDITLVALRRKSEDEAMNEDNGADRQRTLAAFVLPSTPGSEHEAIARVVAAVQGLGLSSQRLERLKTAVGEATMNAMEHGNHYQADQPVAIEVRASPSALAVRITDQGGHTALPKVPTQAPDLAAKLAGEQSPRGWGLFLMHSLVDEVRVSGDEAHHTVELVLALSGQASDSPGASSQAPQEGGDE